MNKVVPVISIFIGLSLLAVTAQTPTDLPPPSPPFVAKAPIPSAWTVTFKLKDPADVAPPIPGLIPLRTIKDIQVTKSSKLRHELTEWSDGKTSEIWYVGPYSLRRTLQRPDIYILSKTQALPGLSSPVQSFDETDFPDLNWLTIESYQSVVTYQGHKCYHFQGNQNQATNDTTQMLPSPDPAKKRVVLPNASPGREAWIDIQTKLPRAVTDGGKYLQIYTFKGESSDQLEMPADFTKAFQDYLARIKAAK